jgi:flagellar protein FlgJ
MLGPQGISSPAALSVLRGAQAGATVKGAADARLKDTAKELEATFLSMLLKQMRETLDTESGGLFPGDSGDVYGGLFDLYMGRHMADGGGIGVADALVRQMQAAGPRSAPALTTDAPARPAPTADRRTPPPPGR